MLFRTVARKYLIRGEGFTFVTMPQNNMVSFTTVGPFMKQLEPLINLEIKTS